MSAISADEPNGGQDPNDGLASRRDVASKPEGGRNHDQTPASRPASNLTAYPAIRSSSSVPLMILLIPT